MGGKCLIFVSIAALVTLFLISAPARAQTPDPLTIAQTAEWQARQEQQRANQANWAADAARTTAAAAYAEATAQAQATAEAQTATAQWVATATPAAATAHAQATADALAVEITRAAINAQSTTAAHQNQAIETAQAQALMATATQQAAWAEMDQLEIQRGRAWQPLYIVGPWLVAVALIVSAGTLLWRATRAGETTRPHLVLRPIPREQSWRARQEGCEHDDDIIEGEYYPLVGLRE